MWRPIPRSPPLLSARTGLAIRSESGTDSGAAIMTPPTGYLAGRFGLKLLFLVSIAGFTVASMLCGMAQSLVEIVLFRVAARLVWRRARPALSDRAARRKRRGAILLSQ